VRDNHTLQWTGPAEAAKVTKGKFDRIHSGMTLRELTDLLGRGWMSQYQGCGIITWTCGDGRQLQVWPTTSRSEEIIEAGPRQLGGTGGRGRMWMTRPGRAAASRTFPSSRSSRRARGGHPNQ
jgi:hypothetical protein